MSDTIPQWLEFCNKTKNDGLREKINLYTMAKLYVTERVPDAHIVKTYDKGSKRWRVAIVSVELALDKRRLIATSRLVAPALIGHEFIYDEKRNPYCQFAIDAYISAQEHLQALETLGR